ncbi:MAG: TonB-dependent receptor plug domain-containing protein [Muribaculaceae bacterium]|nr:TonB-dependent receptor plug domain-containing protein [Muribaculaceae bacterium]
MSKEDITLQELVVTAKEGSGLSSGSRIDRDAMNHLQPSSFTDLLELLPGNISKDPEMGKANTISLRETGNLGATGVKTDNSDYDISSLGTLFMVDGSPISSDSNMQSIGISSDPVADKRNTTNRGVDMRTISTDNIKSVEIIRGIPSAEYGNLSSGVVKIKRIDKATPFIARFKADGYSKLFSAGKGFAPSSDSPIVINADLSYFDSKTDPRNSLENYKRLTGSLRMALSNSNENSSINISVAADYTGSFDNSKTDKDLSQLKVDDYKSSYNRFNLSSDFSYESYRTYLLSEYNLNFSLGYQKDILERRKQVAPQRASVAPTTMTAGENPGEYLLSEYIADYRCIGKPFNIFIKAKAAGDKSSGISNHNYKIGLEWSLSKNFGEGQLYDLSRPLSASWTSRPRSFSEIPALQILSIFAEDETDIDFGTTALSIQTGIRGIMIPGLDSKYKVANRPYLDPRINLKWTFYKGNFMGRFLTGSLFGGWGLTTRMPTADYLFPQAQYSDIIQLNYYDINNPKENSIVSLMTYVNDATNYSLKPARNHKWEIRLALSWNGFSVSTTYFQEKMNDGFRYSTLYSSYEYKKYDSSISPSSKPALSDFPFIYDSTLRGYRYADNGSRITKQGIEWQLSTPRWKPILTKLNISGAWFHSTYSNSGMIFSPVNDVVEGLAVSSKYIGLYDYADGRVNDQVNTNFMFDTQIQKWGLIFTTTLQCMWHIKTTRLPIDGVPVSYLDAKDGLLHEFKNDINDNQLLSYLIREYNDASFDTFKIPFAGYLNIKATKTIGKYLRIALFVTRLIDCLPSYYSNGLLIRRSSNPYFGMELNLTL